MQETPELGQMRQLEKYDAKVDMSIEQAESLTDLQNDLLFQADAVLKHLKDLADNNMESRTEFEERYINTVNGLNAQIRSIKRQIINSDPAVLERKMQLYKETFAEIDTFIDERFGLL